MIKPPAAGNARGQRTREAVLDAAERLIAAQGYAATSMAEIIAESGVASSSIYHHFESKAGVFEAVLDRGAGEFLDAARDARSLDASKDPKQRLYDVMALSAHAMVEHPRFLRLYYSSITGMEGDDAAREAMVRFRARGFDTLTANLEQAFEAWGPKRASQAAARLVPIALPLFDGMFLAHDAGEIPDLDRFAYDATEALYALAEAPPAPRARRRTSSR